MDLFALTMAPFRVQRGLASRAFNSTGVLSYVFTINDYSLMKTVLDAGAASIYTDTLIPQVNFTSRIMRALIELFNQ